MRKLKVKYTHVLIAFSLLVITGLQAIWLQQLFLAQRSQFVNELEGLVRNNTQANVYQVLTNSNGPNEDMKKRINKLFLSPQWDQLRTAANNMYAISGLRYVQSISTNIDSVAVNLNFSMTKHAAKPLRPVVVYTNSTKEEIWKNDSLSMIVMRKKIVTDLKSIGINSKTYYTLYDPYNKVISVADSPSGLKPEYVSRKYAFNLQHDYDYQLIVPHIFSVVLYRMRYYLASSILMIMLTCAAFYVLVRLLRKQRMYSEAKSDFTSNMTHELKTPISTISVALESIKKYKMINDPETLEKFLDISELELQRLNRMIEKVLNIDKAESQELQLHMQLFEVQSGLADVISSMKLQLTDPAGTIILHPTDEPYFVNGDAVHLTNIFYSMIENAIKYSKGVLCLEINCSLLHSNVMISFKDNGPGIDKIYQDNVFDRFFRVPSKGEVHDVRGFGLGLYYVKQITEKHGGSIALRSDLGKGSNFIISLPSAT